MASTFKSQYGTANQTFTITFTSLADAAATQSDAIDNSTDLLLDALIQVIATTGASGTSTLGAINVYVFGTADGGTTYSGGAGASAGAITLSAPPNIPAIGLINANVDSTTYKSPLFSVAHFFGGNMPQKWGIVIENKTGHALAGSNCSAFYQGIYQQAV